LRGVNRIVDILSGGKGEAANDVPRVGGIDVFKALARGAIDPFTADVILISLKLPRAERSFAPNCLPTLAGLSSCAI